MDNYIDCLVKEISYSKSNTASSIFIGGGTPTLLGINHLDDIFVALNDKFDILPDAEITIEANPGTLTRTFLSEIRDIGINRLSIGIQSFIDDELKFLQRIHNANTAEYSIYNARNAGFDNISIDLIFSVPGQTIESWAYSLSQAMKSKIDHISCYSLTYEQGTPLFELHKKGNIKKQDEETDTQLFEYTMQFLETQGYRHYEISNYAKPDKECRHNISYWNGSTYSGFGAAAHSFDGNNRYWNIRSVNKYIDKINKIGNAIAGQEKLSGIDIIEEKIFLGIRCGSLDITNIFPNPKDSLLKEIQNMVYNDYMNFDNGFITLTNKGFLLADEISLRLITLISK